MPKRILISGAMACSPIGGAGNSWAFLQYVLGLRRLGIETYYVEQLAPEDCIDENWNGTSFSRSVNRAYFDMLMERFQLRGTAALLETDGPGYVGLSHAEVEKLAPGIDLLINISGRFQMRQVLRAARRRLYLDIDPGFTQIWQQRYGKDMNLAGHDLYVTVGLNLGRRECRLPTCGIEWHHTLPPVVLDEWVGSGLPCRGYSTVADWRGYGAVEWNGVWYGQKANEFLRLLDLPARVPVPLELCLQIHPDEQDRAELQRHGWRLVSPFDHAATPDAYRNYIISSRGEFTAVKHGYTAAGTGWFSDRSACYLAAGRPVIMQDTGIGAYLPTGNGLLTFTDVENAVTAINRVEEDYCRHAAAAAAFAREFLDSDRVLGRLLRLAGI